MKKKLILVILFIVSLILIETKFDLISINKKVLKIKI